MEKDEEVHRHMRFVCFDRQKTLLVDLSPYIYNCDIRIYRSEQLRFSADINLVLRENFADQHNRINIRALSDLIHHPDWFWFEYDQGGGRIMLGRAYAQSFSQSFSYLCQYELELVCPDFTHMEKKKEESPIVIAWRGGRRIAR